MKTREPKETLGAPRSGGALAGADRSLNESVFIGTHPGLTAAMLEYVITTITKPVRLLKSEAQMCQY